MKKLLISLLVIFTFSCTHNDQTINVKLNLIEEEVNIGRGKKVEVIIVDERRKPNIIGNKRYDQEEIKLTSKEDVTQVLQENISKSLEKKGFEIAKGKNLIIYLRKVRYISKRGFPFGTSGFEGKIIATVTDEKGREKFRKNFNVSLNSNHFIVSSTSKDQELINFALQELHNELLDDRKLLKSLLKK